MIRKAREHLKLSSDDVAAELGITNDQLLRMEFGELRPTPYQLLSLCAVLRVQPSWFFPELSAPVDPHETPGPGPEKPAPAPPKPMVGLAADKEGGVRMSSEQIEISFGSNIRVLVGRDFDETAFRKVVSVLLAF